MGMHLQAKTCRGAYLSGAEGSITCWGTPTKSGVLESNE